MEFETTADPDGCYVLVPRDQDNLNLVLLRKTRNLTAKEKADRQSTGADTRPPNIEIDPRYARLVCPGCSAVDPNRVFDAGFDGDRAIRIAGDFGPSDDGVFLASDRMLAALRRGRVRGFDAARVGTGWSAIRFTCVVAAAPRALKPTGRKCRACGRPAEVLGSYERVSQLEPPGSQRTLFTADATHVGGRAWFRMDVPTPMMTGDVVSILLDSGVKGGACRELLSDADWRAYQREAKLAHGMPQRPGVIAFG
jgi:hypothetical protein